MTFELREYQKNIINSVLKNGNSLVILPTGTGKTIIACEIAKKIEGKKLLLAPSKPLVLQHYEFFKKYFDNIICFTGEMKKDKRKEYYKKENIFIVATPQTIENDLKENPNLLDDFSLIIFDEAHRCVGKYAYANIAKHLNKKHFILGLTASPGYSKEKILEICKNLKIKNIEIRMGDEEDIKKYLPKVEIKIIRVSLPEEYKKIRDLIRNYLKKNKIGSMKNMNRLELLKIQDWAIKNDNYELVVKVSSLLLAIHALYLLETQGVEQLKRFLNELKNKETKSADHLLKSIEFIKIREFIKDIKTDHPKIEKLIEILKDGKKTIIFTNYRDSSSYITEVLNRNNIKSLRFVGQGKKGEEKGLSQKEQKEIIEKFKNENYQCLVCTSVGEEGIDIPKVDRVIFYEPVPSEIRTIQRRGRVGRTQSGGVFFLAAKGTYDEVNLYISRKKEYIMRKIIKEISDEIKKDVKEDLTKWIKI